MARETEAWSTGLGLSLNVFLTLPGPLELPSPTPMPQNNTGTALLPLGRALRQAPWEGGKEEWWLSPVSTQQCSVDTHKPP